MKGIIFNLVEEVVTQDHGVDTWEDLLDSANVPGVYTAVGSYPDTQLQALVQTTAEATEAPVPMVLNHVGRESIPLLRTRYPEFFEVHQDYRSFLGSLNEVIHPEVRKLYDGAEPPIFVIRDAADGSLLMEYHSHRSMCELAEGLIMGAGDAFGENLVVTQPQCKHRGDPHCVLRVTEQ